MMRGTSAPAAAPTIIMSRNSFAPPRIRMASAAGSTMRQTGAATRRPSGRPTTKMERRLIGSKPFCSTLRRSIAPTMTTAEMTVVVSPALSQPMVHPSAGKRSS
jgi:hypothetical protein